MKLSLEEQETIIRWDRKDGAAIIYTFEPSLKRKLQILEHQFPDKIQFTCEDNGSIEYIIPKELVSIRKPRFVSEEAKERLKQNVSKARQKKKPEADTGTQLQAL